MQWLVPERQFLGLNPVTKVESESGSREHSEDFRAACHCFLLPHKFLVFSAQKSLETPAVYRGKSNFMIEIYSTFLYIYILESWQKIQ